MSEPAEDEELQDEELSWEEKYNIADNQLQKFRAQAAKVRELLGKKMRVYEEKIAETEKQRDEALEKVKRLETSVIDKDEAISALREKITSMREEQSQEKEVWEEREKKMKDWIKVKFTDMLKELEQVKKEKKELEAKVKPGKDNTKGNIRKRSGGNDDPNIYEEIFGQILDDLQEPHSHYEPLNSQPPSPEPPPPTPKRPPSLKIKDRGNGNANERRDSQKPVLRRIARFFSNDSQSPSPPLPRERRVSKKNSAAAPTVGKKGSFRRSSNYISTPTTSENNPEEIRPRTSTDSSEVFVSDSPKRLSNSDFPTPVSKSTSSSVENKVIDNNENEVNRKASSESRSEPFYFTLKETHYGMEFENETKAPVYATLKGTAAQLRTTPFSGDSTDSEADHVEDPSGIIRSTSVRVQQRQPNIPPHLYTQGSRHSIGTFDKKVLKTCAPYTAQNMRNETLEKAGYLTKLGGRVKNWKRRYFVLAEGKLSYYKNQNDMYRKPLGQISLETVTKIARSERENTFELVTPKRIYYLTAESQEVVDGWLRVLRNSLKRFAGAQVLSKAGEKTIYSGWVTKVKGGSSKHVWCVLKEKSLLFYKNDSDQSPMSSINLREIISVAPLDESSESSEIYAFEDDGRCTLVVQPIKDTHPTYLVIPSMKERDEWLSHITSLCSETSKEEETEFESLVTKLMNVDGDIGSRFWRNPVLIHSRGLITEPLTTLPSPELQGHAVRMFKSISLYSTTPINEQAIDYHIALAQDTLKMCFEHPELQTELFCQLIKQTTKLKHKHGMKQIQSFLSGQSDWLVDQPGDHTIDLNPVPDFVYVQSWQLLALATSLFLPKLKVLWLLKVHLQRCTNPSTDPGRYALYSSRSLERTLKNGEREARPSRPEVMSIVLRNPYYRPLPMSIPVYFVNNAYQVFSFDGSTTVTEFSERINLETGIRECSQSGYALFTDNPIAPVEHCLQGELKVCDVISKWEQAMKTLGQGKFERQRVIKLTYKNRLYMKSLSKFETNKERFLLCYQVNDSIMAGHLQPASETAFQLTALLAQIEYGNYGDNFRHLDEAIEKFCPDHHKGYRVDNFDNGGVKRKMYKSIADAWASLRGKNMNECVNIYLGIARSFPFFGSRIFEAKGKLQPKGKKDKEEQASVILAIEEEKISILDSVHRTIIANYTYTQVVTFGGYKDDFMLVVQDSPSSTEKTSRHLFAMSPGKVLEVTFLVASYINAVVTRKGLNLELKQNQPRTKTNEVISKSSNNPMVRKSGTIVQLWDMESVG